MNNEILLPNRCHNFAKTGLLRLYSRESASANVLAKSFYREKGNFLYPFPPPFPLPKKKEKLKKRRGFKKKKSRKKERKRRRTSFNFFQLLPVLFSIKRNYTEKAIEFIPSLIPFFRIRKNNEKRAKLIIKRKKRNKKK